MSLPGFIVASVLVVAGVAMIAALDKRRQNPVDEEHKYEAKISCYGPGSRVLVRKALDAMGIGPDRRSYAGATRESLPAWYVEVTVSEWLEILSWRISGTEKVEIDLTLVTAIQRMDGDL